MTEPTGHPRRVVKAVADKTRPARRRVVRHVREHKRGWTGFVVALVIAQMIWDISANDLAAYVQPLFTALLGEPPK